MAYGSSRRGGLARNNRGNVDQGQTGRNKSATINLELNADALYQCSSTKQYTDSFTISQELDNSDGFITLTSFSKDVSSLTVNNAKAIVIKNISNICAELAIVVIDWRNDSASGSYTTADVTNSIDLNEENSTGEETATRCWTAILPKGEFIYLPTSRIVSYAPLVAATLESAALAPIGTIAIEPKDIHSGNEFSDVRLISGTAYGTGTEVLTDEAVAIGESAIDVDDGDWFKVGDLIMIDQEVMSIESISTNTLTVKRGLLGSTDVAHTEDDELHYFFGNEYLPFDNGKCMTDQTGKFKQRGAFFGYGRTADKIASGIVPGSIAIGPFYTQGGYLDWGLQNIKASDKTGLAASTTYTFHIVVDEFNVGGIDSVSTETAIAFTTDSSDTTFAGSGNAVLPKIQARFDALFYDASSGLFNKRVRISLLNGDIRVSSGSNHSDTRVGIANVSGTTPFDVGRFPSLASGVPSLQGSEHGGGTTDTIVFGPTSSLAPETIDDRVTGKTNTNTSAFIFDDGNGNLLFNGANVGWIDYEKGHCEFRHLPNAEFKIYAESHSAHSGGASYIVNGYNTIQAIKGRSMNPKENTKLQVILLG